MTLAVTLLDYAGQSSGGAGSGDVVDLQEDGIAREFGAFRAIVRSSIPSPITLKVETSPTTSGPWSPALHFASATSTSTVELLHTHKLDRYARLTWGANMGGSDEISVLGEVCPLYALPEHVDALSVPAAARDGLSANDLALIAKSATDFANSHLCQQYDLPLTSFGSDLRRACAHVMGYDIMCTLGFRPDQYDENVRQRYEDAVAWFEAVARGEKCPAGVVDASPDTEQGGAFVYADTVRGW